ncbi:MAG: ABC transporter ATP-binding protein [Duncaniella sp.]|nr:ABC transporter ATP-binding protein [Duncaniella sp.]
MKIHYFCYMKEQSPAISISDLSIGYKSTGGREKIVAENLNGRLNNGTMTCLLGPNGAGKSTLLRTLAGFQPALAGEISIMGNDALTISRQEKARLLGVVLTDRISLENTSVGELIALGRSPFTGFWGKLSDNDLAEVRQAAEMIGIVHLLDRRVGSLSDGERQKVMIAKVLAQKTPVIFLDEPTAFLDYPGKVDVMRLLRNLAHDEGKTIFMSTHDLEIALRITDNVWLLDQRHGLTTGSPESLASSGLYRDYFRLPAEFDPFPACLKG